jgi:anti-anti-sigma factor
VDGVAVLSTEGQLDRSTAQSATWTKAVAAECATGAIKTALVLDVRRLYFMDLAGLAALERLAATLESRGRSLVLGGARPRVREFLRKSSVTMSAAALTLEEAVAAAATATGLGTAA